MQIPYFSKVSVAEGPHHTAVQQGFHFFGVGYLDLGAEPHIWIVLL